MFDSLPRRLGMLWERLRTHILFIPGALVVLAIGLAVATIELDRRIDTETIRGVPWVFRAGASGARDVLATVATAMIQLAAITFSVTIVALALRSQQFGPRLLRNFTADHLNQGILGVFIGTFLYALLVLRTVRDLDDVEGLDTETFIPLVSVTFSIALAVVSLALFVVFIDRIVSSIQASSIIAEAAKETHGTIDSLFPEPLGEGPEAEEESETSAPPGQPVEVAALQTGYIQTLAADELMEIACASELMVRMEAPIGGFVVKGTPLATVSPGEHVDTELIRRIQALYAIGRDRSAKEDPEFGIRQIVDVAVKALSPSANDPTTACIATEYLGAILIDFATRAIPSRIRRDAHGAVRVIAPGPTFRSMADLAFNQIREHGANDIAATLQLLETLARVATAVKPGPRQTVLEQHVWKIARSADRNIHDPIDRDAVNRRLQLAMARLGREDRNTLHYLLPLGSTPGEHRPLDRWTTNNRA